MVRYGAIIFLQCKVYQEKAPNAPYWTDTANLVQNCRVC